MEASILPHYKERTKDGGKLSHMNNGEKDTDGGKHSSTSIEEESVDASTANTNTGDKDADRGKHGDNCIGERDLEGGKHSNTLLLDGGTQIVAGTVKYLRMANTLNIRWRGHSGGKHCNISRQHCGKGHE